MFQDILNMEGESVKRRHDLIPVSKSVLLGIDLSSDLQICIFKLDQTGFTQSWADITVRYERLWLKKTVLDEL